MTDSQADDPVRAGRARRNTRLILDVSISPGCVSGTVSAEGRVATGFEGWLGLAQAVAAAAGDRSGAAAIAGPALLGVSPQEDGRTPRAADGR